MISLAFRHTEYSEYNEDMKSTTGSRFQFVKHEDSVFDRIYLSLSWVAHDIMVIHNRQRVKTVNSPLQHYITNVENESITVGNAFCCSYGLRTNQSMPVGLSQIVCLQWIQCVHYRSVEQASQSVIEKSVQLPLKNENKQSCSMCFSHKKKELNVGNPLLYRILRNSSAGRRVLEDRRLDYCLRMAFFPNYLMEYLSFCEAF